MKKNAWLALAWVFVGCREARGAGPAGEQGVVEFDERTVAFEVPGRVRALSVVRGQPVTDGVVVASLDDSLARPVREARAADLEAARARWSLARAGARGSDLRSLEAQIAGARATESTAARELSRARELAASGSAPTAQVDTLSGQYDRAHAERVAAEERLHTLRSGARPQEIDAAHAQVEAATQALAAEDQRLSRYTLRAQGDGVVVDVLVDPGEVVAAGAPVATVADVRHPFVDVFVPQGRLDGVRVGLAATVRVDATRATFRGAVEDVGREVEFTPRFLFSEQERPNLVVRVRVRVDDPQARLHAGVPAFVTLARSQP